MPEALRWLFRLGPTNPIAVRLVQNGSRRTRHLYIRATYLGVLILVLLWSLLTSAGGSGALSYRDLALAGANSFTLVAYLQIGLICVLAPVFMAGAIAQEASPRTWEVLLTTPLTRSEIVLGNLFGRLFFILALLLASLPLFAVTQFFGGVPGQAIFASYGIAAAAALLVGSTAIALSVSRLVGKRAVFAFYVGVVTSIAVTYAVDAWLRSRGAGRRIERHRRHVDDGPEPVSRPRGPAQSLRISACRARHRLGVLPPVDARKPRDVVVRRRLGLQPRAPAGINLHRARRRVGRDGHDER